MKLILPFVFFAILSTFASASHGVAPDCTNPFESLAHEECNEPLDCSDAGYALTHDECNEPLDCSDAGYALTHEEDCSEPVTQNQVPEIISTNYAPAVVYAGNEVAVSAIASDSDGSVVRIVAQGPGFDGAKAFDCSQSPC